MQQNYSLLKTVLLKKIILKQIFPKKPLQVNFQEYVEIHGVAKNFVKKFFIQFQKGYT